MSSKIKINQKWIAAVISVVLGVGVGFLLHYFKGGRGLVNLSYDLLLVARGHIVPTEAVMVVLDEESHRQLAEPLNAPWKRSRHAALLDRLTAAGAKAVAFDIVFSDPTTPEEDQRFAEAIKKNGKVILAIDSVPGEGIGKRLDPPIDIFLDNAATNGSAEVLPDRDLIVREHPPNTPREVIPSLTWATAEVVQAPTTKEPGSDGQPRWINYYGPPGIIPIVRYSDALDKKIVPDEAFRAKVVFVGARFLTKFSGGRKDEYRNPFTFWLSEDAQQIFIAGVEIQTTACLNLLRGDWLRRLSVAWEESIIILMGFIAGLGLIRLRPLWATGVGLASSAIVALAAFVAFKNTLVWFPWLIIVVQTMAVVLWSVLFNSVQLYVQKRLYEQTLALYLSPRLVAKFSKDSKLLQRGANKQVLTILFTDIANFTSISDGLDPDQLEKLMNNYFQSAVSGCIHPTDGTVVKYIGDAIFAFWNAPDQQLDHQMRACQAALRFSEQPKHHVNGKPLLTRIGLHTGVANVGNFGSTDRFDYTALGDSINLASRMEGLNKYLGTELLISGDTRKGIDEQFTTRFLGLFRLKGFEKSVEVYELVARSNESEGSKPWREAFAEGHRQFQQRKFEAAEAAFRRTMELKPQDGPSRFFLARIAELRSETLPADWRGEIELKEK